MDPKREDQPRISICTIQHWQRVRADYTNALIAQLDSRLAAAGMTQDKKLFLPHMNQYIDTVFQSAKPNIRVNGRNFEDLDGKEEEIEPFDEALDRHIWSLSDQHLKWDREIARTRTEKPKEVETMLQDLFDQQHGVTTEEIDPAIGESFRIQDDPVLGERHQQTAHIFHQTSALSEELNQLIPVQYERSTRIMTSTKEVTSLKA